MKTLHQPVKTETKAGEMTQQNQDILPHPPRVVHDHHSLLRQW